MGYKNMKKKTEQMMDASYRDYIKAAVSIEKDINCSKTLDLIFDKYIEDDSIQLLGSDFDMLIKSINSLHNS